MLRRFVVLCIGWVLVATCSVSPAQEAEPEGERTPALNGDLPEYGGVVVDQTISVLGRFFYVRFSEGWSQLSDTDSFALAIRERPSPRGGTEIQVISNDSVVVRQFLPRSYPAAGGLATAMVERVHGSLKQLLLQAVAGEGGDLARHGY